MPDRSFYYPWIMGLSAFIGILWTWIQAGDEPRRLIKQTDSTQSLALNTALLALTGALVGSRLAYLGLHIQAYRTLPEALSSNWFSGLDWIGAPFGAFLFLLPFAGSHRTRAKEILVSLTPLWTCICFGAWFAVSIVPVYYSSEMPPAIWSVNLPDLFGNIEPRFPIGFVGVVWTVFADISAQRRTQYLSIPILRLINLISSQMILCFLLSFIRVDYVPTIYRIPADRLFAILYLIGCFIAYLLLKRSSTVRKLPLRG